MATAGSRGAVLYATGAVVVLIGGIVALTGDEGRAWVLLGVLAVSAGAFLLAWLGSRPTADRSRSVPQHVRVVRAGYIVGLALSGLLVLRPASALTVSDLLFLATFGLCVIYLAREDAPSRPIPPWIGIGVGIFSVGALVASVGATQVDESLGILLRFGFVAWAWLWLGVQVMDDWPLLRAGSAAWAAGGAIAAAGAVLQAVLGDVIPGTAIAWGRMTGFTQNVNDLGGVCAIALPISMALTADAIRRRSGWTLVYVALGLLNLVGLVLSGSVGGLAAALVGVIAVAMTVRWSVGMVALATLGSAGAAALVVALGFGTTVIERYGIVTGPAGDPSATLWTRLDAISAAWEVLQGQPLVGVGLAPGGAVTETGYAVHNVLIAAWYQAGILGLAGISLLLGGAVAEGLRTLRQVPRRDNHRDVIAGIVGSLAAAIVLGFGSPILYQRYFWIPIAMLLAVRALGRTTSSLTALPAPPLNLGS